MTPPLSTSLVVNLEDINRSHVDLVGGKAAMLGELTHLPDVAIPAAFCVTTVAFAHAVRDDASIRDLLEQLADIAPDDRGTADAISTEICQAVGALAIPADLTSAIDDAMQWLGAADRLAVRSSATAEDLPTASFAGQHDSFLDVAPSALLDHVRRCWASLFTERAITYRTRREIDHREVRMAVIVQQLVRPRAAGVLFTADPLTSNRTVASIEATTGLGDALVSGTVSPESYKVRNGTIEATIAEDVPPNETLDGGSSQTTLEAERQPAPALTHAQIQDLVALGRRIEAHLGAPQDIEWCLTDDGFTVVQSRPITTLFPIPAASDAVNRVYVSVGHQQMMTDPMKPLGLSFWQMTSPAPMAEAGSRLFVDVTAQLGSPAAREGLFSVLGRSDPLARDALQTVLDRSDFLAPTADDASGTAPPWSGPPQPLDPDPAIVDDLVSHWRSSLEELRREIRATSGPELFDLIERDLDVLRGLLFEPRSLQVIMTAVDATWWLNDHLDQWVGERNVADALTQSAPNNVTSEMGLALLDVADVIRPLPAVVEYLGRISGDHADFLDDLRQVAGGADASDAIAGFLDQYGMRCVGEIDITRPRWAERPSALVPLILGHVRNTQPGEAKRRFEQGRRDAAAKEAEILERLRALPDGGSKAAATKEMIDRVRTFIGYREYPKYAWISRYQEYRRALLAEAEKLQRAGILDHAEDCYFLSFDEFRSAVCATSVNRETIAARKDVFESHRALNPPRVLTSDGEALTGHHRPDDLPAGAFAGLAVSGGVVEGRARVISDMADADVEPGDIVVTTHTDPSWSPLFVAIKGLVTEVGGLMTHGAVVAREYGLPAVVGVAHATDRIADGQRIRVDGTNGYVEVLTP